MSINIPNIIDRYFLFVTAGQKTAANAIMQGGHPDPDASNADFFTVDLSAAPGGGPVTHNAGAYWVDANLAALMESVPGQITVYKKSEGWTLQTAADHMGLQIVEPVE